MIGFDTLAEMNDSIYVHRYSLRSRAPLNAKSVRNEHHGALIRVGDGYGCLHPWPELGDLVLEDQLDHLRDGKMTPITRAALSCAQADAQARADGRSLFEGLQVPRSHATLPMDEAAFQSAVDAGFDRVKVKMGRDLEREAEFVKAMADRFPALRWRMDLNGTQKWQDVQRVVCSWDEALLVKIDFLEDAFSGPMGPISSLGDIETIPLAVDREVKARLEEFSTAILKPAINEMPSLLKRAQSAAKRVVITSYMDHPLGQTYAAWQAAVALRDFPDLIDPCGLITHGLFEPDDFTEALGRPSPDFHPPSATGAGTGLGFDDLLERLPWIPLK